MHRAYASGAANSAPVPPTSPSIGYPTAGNPGAAIPATRPGPWWYHMTTEELLAIITAAGIAPDQAQTNQVLTAIQKMAQSQSATAFPATGAAPTYVLTPSPALSALAAGTRYRVAFAQATSASATLAVSGLAAKALKQYDGSGAKVDAKIGAGMLTDVEYDGADWVVLDPLPISSNSRQLCVVGASVASNALTVTASGGTLDFRSSDLTSGAVNSRTFSNLSLTVPSGATLGTTSAQAARLILIALDNAGTIELAVCNLAGGINLDETNLISTTAISASAAAANVIYSTTARTNVPFRVVGFIDSTQATAGTWATAPTKVQGCGGQAMAGLVGLGYGKPVDVRGSRAAGVTYYNTTGRPMFLTIYATMAAAYGLTVLRDGIQILCGATVGGGVYTAGGFWVIPPGVSYQLMSNGVNGITNWMESN